MRRPNVLDLVHAVSQVAPGHPEVQAWWYSPLGRTASPSLPSQDGGPARETVIAVEANGGGTPDLERIRRELTARLSDRPVLVRIHQGPVETGLYRLVTRKG